MWGACASRVVSQLYATTIISKPPGDALADLFRISRSCFDSGKAGSLSRSALVSDVRHTGVDHEREFNETLATLLQMIVRRKPQNYSVDPALREALLDRVLTRYRNSETGYWGERYRRDGREDFPDDLSMTFHVISYLKGKVPLTCRTSSTQR